MSIHGLCFDEGSAGRCGFECREFTSGECGIYEEIVFNSPITWADFEEASLHYNLQVTEMNRITNLIVAQVEKNAKLVKVLAAINKVPWDSIKIDEPVICSDDLHEFCSGVNKKPAHFAKFDKERESISVFANGTSSLTGDIMRDYKFALPQSLYKEFIE